MTVAQTSQKPVVVAAALTQACPGVIRSQRWKKDPCHRAELCKGNALASGLAHRGQATLR